LTLDFTHILEHHLLDHVSRRLPPVLGVSLPLSKHVLMMWIAGSLAILLFVPVGVAARAGSRGVAVNLVESFVVFIRDEIVIANMGEHGRKYVPYFISLFFFILFCNLLGLVPFGATATGNIAVTATLALITFAMINISGMIEQGVFHYLKNLVPHGLPVWLAPLMFPIEVLGLVTKSFALCIRLFANMIAGHIVILAFMALIFLFGSVLVAPVSVAAAVGMNMLELFVAFLQAYIFTLLSAMFVGGAVHPEH
jgi:F-type H+-transporting ATPase subunit a